MTLPGLLQKRLFPSHHWIEEDEIFDSDDCLPPPMPAIEPGTNHPYSETTLSWYRCQWNNRHLNPNYLTEIQKDWDAKDRTMSVDWMIRTGFLIAAQDEGILLSIRIYELVISAVAIERSLIPLYCACSLLMGNKFVERSYSTSLCREIANQTHDVEEQDILDLECKIFSILDFNMIISTPLIFVRYYLPMFETGSDFVEEYTRYFIFSSVLLDQCSSFNDELIAIVCVSLAASVIAVEFDPKMFKRFDDLGDATDFVVMAVRSATEDPRSILASLFDHCVDPIRKYIAGFNRDAFMAKFNNL